MDSYSMCVAFGKGQKPDGFKDYEARPLCNYFRDRQPRQVFGSVFFKSEQQTLGCVWEAELSSFFSSFASLILAFYRHRVIMCHRTAGLFWFFLSSSATHLAPDTLDAVRELFTRGHD